MNPNGNPYNNGPNPQMPNPQAPQMQPQVAMPQNFNANPYAQNQAMPQMANTPANITNMQNQAMQQQAKPKKSIAEIALIAVIFLISVGAFAGGIYFMVEKNNLNSQVMSDRSVKISEATEEQKAIDDASYEKRKASTTKEFSGPSNFGAIAFYYPKEWNVYISNDSDIKPEFEAFLTPDYVPKEGDNNSYYAIHFKVLQETYDTTYKDYASKEEYSQTPLEGTSLTGVTFYGRPDKDKPSKKITLIKVNSYSAIIETNDADRFIDDYDAVIKTIKSNNQ